MTIRPLLVAALTLSASLAAPLAAKEAVPEVVARAADLYARDVAGAIVCRTKLESRIKSPIFNRHTIMDSWVVSKDGLPVRTRIVALRNDGKDASKDELKKQEAQTNETHQEGKAFFKPPYDRRYMSDYSYDVAEERGLTVVTFKSALKDQQHGSGTFTVDAEYRVRKLTFRPNAFPKNVDRGSFTIERGDIGGGIFAPRRLELDYEGSMGFIKGGMQLEQDYESYSRYKSLEEALSEGPIAKTAR